MKNRTIIVVCGIFCLGLALFSGCSLSSDSNSGDTLYSQNVSGDTVSAGTVSALCPDGWTSIGAPDMTSSDSSATADNEIRFVKGGSSEEDILTNAYIDIIYYAEGSEIMEIDPTEWYDNVEEIEEFTTGNYTWAGYSAQSLGVPFVYMRCETDGNTLEVYLYTREGSENSASITDEDVLSILESITF